MKKCFILFVTACLLSNFSLMSQELPENSSESEVGLVYFLRGKGHAGSATAFSVLIDEVRVCKLNNRRYSAHEVNPGIHTFKAQFGGKKGKKKAEIVEIEIVAGETYYIQLVMQASFWVNDVSPVEITRSSALRIYQEDKIKLDPNCGEVHSSVNNQEAKSPVMTREQAIAKLKEAKDLVEIEMMTQEEYDKLKAELAPIIMNK